MVNVNANPIVQHVIQIKNGIMKYVNVNVKVIASAKKIIVAILAHVLVRIASTLKVLLILQWLSVMKLYVMDTVSTKMANTITADVSMNCRSKKQI